MPLESVTLISDLVSANPAPTDGLGEADDHIRNIKAALLATFPNINAAITASDENLNAVPQALTDIANLGTSKVAKAGDTMTGGLTLSAGDINVAAGKVKEAGNPLIPQGLIAMWSGAANAIPAGWALCDGQAHSGVSTPDLRDRFIVGAGNSYAVGATGGAATFPGTTGPGGGHTPTGVTGVSGGHSHGGATQGHALTVPELAAHSHLSPSGSNFIVKGSGGSTGSSGGILVDGGSPSTQNTGLGVPHTHPLTTDGDHQHTLVANTVPDHTHSVTGDNRPPYYALCFIMKL